MVCSKPCQRRSIQGTLILALVLGSAGCSSWRMPWDKPPVKIAGVQTAKERMEILRKETKEIASKSVPEQEQFAQRLAGEIQKEDDPAIRAEIIKSLGTNPSPVAAAVLKAGMSDTTRAVRVAACQAWSLRGGPEAAVELGLKATSDSELDVRVAAARGLGKIKDPQAVKALGQTLSDSDPALQFVAVTSLKQISEKDYGNDVSAWRSYALGEPVNYTPPSLAERMKQTLHY